MAFAVKRIPVLFLFSGLHGDYHRPSDDADKINYTGLAQAVDVAQDLVTQIAAAPKQAYVEKSDSSSLRLGMTGDANSGSAGGGGGTRVTLGVVPDYGSFGEGGGVRISGTSPDSPASAAGLKAGDVIVKFDEKKIDTLYDLSDELAAAKPGQKVKLQVLRDGGKTPVELQATLALRKG
jgi:S1-C subfamily serine protease